MNVQKAPTRAERSVDEYAVTDGFFGAAYIDVDEQRSTPRPHRHLHGGFTGTHTRFSLYLPPADQYQGRLLNFLEGAMGGYERSITSAMTPLAAPTSPGTFDLAFDELGAAILETNSGHLGPDMSGLQGDPSIWWRSNAESARLSKWLAEGIYGVAPHHTYAWGGSSGGAFALQCAENAGDVYDGVVPFVVSTGGIRTYSAHAYAVATLGDRIADVVDATAVGGSGNPFDGLDSLQREALSTLYRTGWPRGAESQLEMDIVWGFLMTVLRQYDTQYFDDFWAIPGHVGADSPESVMPPIIRRTAVVRRLLTASELAAQFPSSVWPWQFDDPTTPCGVVLDIEQPDDRLFLSKLTVATGASAGRELYVTGIADGVLMPFAPFHPDAFRGVMEGDHLTIDNRDFIAFCHYHRYAGAERGEPWWSVDGHAVFPQRPGGGGRGHGGRFDGKMIYCQGVHDARVFLPNDYPQRALEYHGDALDDHFRHWWMDRASHSPPSILRPDKVWETRLVDYGGLIDQALRDLVRWVEYDEAPARMRYEFTSDNALVLAPTATERGGIQPVVHVTADGGARAEVLTGQMVTLRGVAEVPPGAGTIVRAEWDFDGTATWPRQCPELADGSSSRIEAEVTHVYDAPGTYFPTFRVGSHREGARGRGASVDNLAQARVVVREA